jgi:hypothetical protein
VTSPLPPQAPKLPSRGASAILATALLAAGIALGALIGPGSASSLASTSRAAALGRVLALLALGSGTGSGGDLLLSSGAAHPQATAAQPTPSSTSEATAGSGGGEAGGSPSASPSPSHTHSSPSSRSVSPTSSTTPAAGEGEGEKTHATEPLPPIAQVWLIVLPYGESLENVLKQSAAAPYLDGQLKGEGTVLSGYSSLAAGQLAGAATLLSGQVAASVTTLTPPPCDASATTGATPGAAGAASPTASTPGATAGQEVAAGTAGAPCWPISARPGEPAGVQAADAFLREVVPKIQASPSYAEHGLIAITFGADQQGASPSAAAAPSTGTEAAGTGIAYPAGTLTNTLTAAGTPAGALLLSPFLRHAGGRATSAFNPLSPRESLEGLLRAKASS